jgi:hypothetical protein
MLNEIQERLNQIDPQAELLRLNLVFGLFCKTDPKDMIEPGLWLLELWQQQFGAKMSWTLVGSSTSRLSKVNKGTHAKITREIRASAKKDLDFYRLQGPQIYGSDYMLWWSLNQDAKESYYPRSNLVEIMLPLPVDQDGWLRCEYLFREISEQFPYDSGYAAPSLVFCVETEMDKAGELIGPLARRHPGLDVANNDTTAFFIDRMTRGARWITFLSQSNAQQLDATLMKSHPEQIEFTKTANGLMIKSSNLPEIGDTNRNLDVSGLRYVAKLLRPITFFGDKNLRMLLLDDLELVDAWEQRFFDE